MEKRKKAEFASSSTKFCELFQSRLGSPIVSPRWTVTKLKWPKPRLEASAVAERSQSVVKAFAGVTRAGSREPVHVSIARAFGKSADSLGGANECRALLTVLYPDSGRSLAASCPSCPCEMWKINRLEGADGSKHTRTHTQRTYTLVHCARADSYTHTHRYACYTHIDVHGLAETQTLGHQHTLGPGSPRCHIMRAPARPSHEASAEMIQGPPLGRRSVGQVELHTRMTAQLQHYAASL